MCDCGTPRECCSGSVVKAQARVREGYKAHGDRESAVRCAKRYAAKLTQEGDGAYFIPAKPARLKPGKGLHGGAGKRFMAPKVRG